MLVPNVLYMYIYNDASLDEYVIYYIMDRGPLFTCVYAYIPDAYIYIYMLDGISNYAVRIRKQRDTKQLAS